MTIEADIIKALVEEIENKTCTHEDTYRGGAIWEICHDCNAKWADDQGGKPPFKWSDAVTSAKAYLSLLTPTIRCKTCNDKGIVGGWVGGVEGGYETEECPDCSALDAQFLENGE